MADLRLQLRLERRTGVLAGIVASLSRAGLELVSQKVEADSSGRGGQLALRVEGESPDPEQLAATLGDARGVERVTWIQIDGRTVLSEPAALDDPIGSDDLVRLSAGVEGGAAGAKRARTGDDSAPIDGPTSTSSPKPDDAAPEAAPPPDTEPDTEPGPVQVPDREQQPAAVSDRSIEADAAGGDGLPEAPSAPADTAPEAAPTAADVGSSPSAVGRESRRLNAMRRRRRRRH